MAVKSETVVTIAALAVAIVAIFLTRHVVTGQGSDGGGIAGPIIGGNSFNVTPNNYQVPRNDYPPANTCGCGTAAGINLASDYSDPSLAALFQSAYPGANSLASNDPSRPQQVALNYDPLLIGNGGNVGTSIGSGMN